MQDKNMFSYGGILREKKDIFWISRGMKPTTRYRKYFYDFLPIKRLKKFFMSHNCYT